MISTDSAAAIPCWTSSKSRISTVCRHPSSAPPNSPTCSFSFIPTARAFAYKDWTSSGRTCLLMRYTNLSTEICLILLLRVPISSILGSFAHSRAKPSSGHKSISSRYRPTNASINAQKFHQSIGIEFCESDVKAHLKPHNKPSWIASFIADTATNSKPSRCFMCGAKTASAYAIIPSRPSILGEAVSSQKAPTQRSTFSGRVLKNA